MKRQNGYPLVSIIMTVFNAADFVAESIESIQGQTYENWELIIVNDGSTDSTINILRKYYKVDNRIILVNCHKNRGASYASNIGLSKARGEFIARMDADDISLPDRISSEVKFLQNNPNVIVVGGQCILIDIEGNIIGMKNFPIEHKDIHEALYQYNPIQHPSMLINSKLLGRHKITYHTKVLLAHDLEILFKLAQYGKLANLSKPVLKYRIHNDSLSLRNPKETFKHTLAVRELARLNYGYVPSNRGSLIHILQKMILTILPSIVVYPLFRILRIRRMVEFKAQFRYATALVVGLLSR